MKGAKAIGKALKVNTSLKYISLHGNNIGAEGREALREARKSILDAILRIRLIGR